MRRDNASAYLDGLIAAAQSLRGSSGHMTLALLGNLYAHRLSPSTDVEQNLSLQAAFEDFGLDPKEDAHWRLLLALFAEAYYEPRRPRGGLKYWGGLQLCRLLADFAVVKKANPDVRSEEEICKRMKLKFTKRYAGQSAPTLRRKLQDARSPAKNRILSSTIRGVPRADTRGMTTKQVRDYAIEQISKR
jgi:hypothetical protein